MHCDSSPFPDAGPAPWLASIDTFASPHDAAPLRRMARAFASQCGTRSADGHGTLRRFRWLAAVTGHDVVMGKLFEPHLDAMSILEELHTSAAATALALALPQDALWAVWAAEGPGALRAAQDADGRWRLQGCKSWCSGAARVDAALVSARDSEGQPRLFAVALKAAGVRITAEGWSAVGMAQTESVDVLFDNAAAAPVGGVGSYTHRPGFWHGAAGIAACWHGAAVAIAQPLRERAGAGAPPDPFVLAALGAVDAVLSSAATVLRDAAAAIDLHRASGSAFGLREALRVRTVVEEAAQTTIQRTGRALGAGPLCRDSAHARRVADLAVFLRQSHAERDAAALGGRAVQEGVQAWML